MDFNELIEAENVKYELLEQVKSLVEEMKLTIESLEDASKGINDSYLINGERIDDNKISEIKDILTENKTFLEEKILKLNV